VDLLLLANHKDNKTVLGSKIIDVERGSFVTSELKLMDRWGWSKSKVRKFLTLLENDKMIVKKSDSKKTTITIVNYSFYQDKETTEEPQKDHRKTTEEPQKDTNKNDKNDKNDKKDISTYIDTNTDIDTKDINQNKEVLVPAPYEKIKNLYNEICTSLPKVKAITDARRTHIKARWNQFKQNIEIFEQVFRKVEASDFCKGKNDRGWKADFDWLIKNDTNMTKVLEGKYDNKKNLTFERDAYKPWTPPEG
jgi:DNA replication protein DnaD